MEINELNQEAVVAETETGAKSDVTPTSTPEKSQAESVSQPEAKTTEVKAPVSGTEPAKQRFEDNPGFKHLKTQRDSFKTELEKAQKLNAELMEALKGRQTVTSPQEGEQEAARKQLMQVLGLEDVMKKLESLEKRNQDYTQSQMDQAFDKEQDEIVATCKKFGLDFNTVAPELDNYVANHPVLSKSIQPGVYKLAFKDMYFDKSTEIAKRAAYAEQLAEKEKLKKANSEAPSPAQTSGNSTSPFSTREMVKQRISESGGISFPGR